MFQEPVLSKRYGTFYGAQKSRELSENVYCTTITLENVVFMLKSKIGDSTIGRGQLTK